MRAEHCSARTVKEVDKPGTGYSARQVIAVAERPEPVPALRELRRIGIFRIEGRTVTPVLSTSDRVRTGIAFRSWSGLRGDRKDQARLKEPGPRIHKRARVQAVTPDSAASR